MITFQIEPWDTYWTDAEALWGEHHAEIGSEEAPPEIDHTSYRIFEMMGQLQILTVREDGLMIGYVVMLIRRHPHYPVLCAFEDAFFLKKTARKGRLGLRMIQAALTTAAARGAKKAIFYSSVKKDLTKLFAHLGFAPLYELWTKEL